MKRKLQIIAYLLMFFVNSYNIFSQTTASSGRCGTDFEGQLQVKFTPAELSQARSAVNPTQYVFNVKVHYINNNVPVPTKS